MALVAVVAYATTICDGSVSNSLTIVSLSWKCVRVANTSDTRPATHVRQLTL